MGEGKLKPEPEPTEAYERHMAFNADLAELPVAQLDPRLVQGAAKLAMAETPTPQRARTGDELEDWLRDSGGD